MMRSYFPTAFVFLFAILEVRSYILDMPFLYQQARIVIYPGLSILFYW